VVVRPRGKQVELFLFSFRLSFSGEAVHRPIDRTTGVSRVSVRGDGLMRLRHHPLR
jgi:hypothetical protein